MKRFCELSVDVLNKYAPRKKKYPRRNQMPFFIKELSKEIMTRSRLPNKYLKTRNEQNIAMHVKQRNYCVSLLRKSNYNPMQCLRKLLEKWKRPVDGGKVFGALLTDLSKAFDYLDHELLRAKFNAYGFSLSALRLINNYLSNRKQRTRIGNSFSDWFEVMLGVPRGSILAPRLFNIFLADLGLFLKDVDIANFTDDNTPFTSANNIDDLINSLEKASSSLFKWFKNNLFKGNPDKRHLLVSTNEKAKINIGEFSIENSDCEKLLGVKIDNKLTFDCHVSDICKKANKRCILMNSFFRSQFNYCLLKWPNNQQENKSIP